MDKSVLNDAECLWYYLVTEVKDKHCCLPITEQWDFKRGIRLGQWREVYPEKYRAMKLRAVRLLKAIKDNGGVKKYDDPEFAKKKLQDILDFVVFLGTNRQGLWLLKHFGIL